jgi:hypothetical protein
MKSRCGSSTSPHDLYVSTTRYRRLLAVAYAALLPRSLAHLEPGARSLLRLGRTIETARGDPSDAAAGTARVTMSGSDGGARRVGLGCEGDDPACLARGGEALGVRRLIYGRLEVEGGHYRLELDMLEVDTASVVTSSSIPIMPDDLLPDRIRATADRVASQMVPEEVAAPPEPEPVVAAATPPRFWPLPWSRRRSSPPCCSCTVPTRRNALSERVALAGL